MRKIISILVILLLVQISTASTYYISPSGNDGNSGTISFPWATINYARSILIAGDILYIRGGSYSEDHILWNSPSGSSGNPITIKAYPTEIPIFTGNYTNYPFIDILGADWLIFDGITINHYPNYAFWIGNDSSPTNDATNIALRNLTLNDEGNRGATHPALEHGIYVSYHVNTLEISGCKIFNTTGAGIQFYHDPAATNVTIYNNIIDGKNLSNWGIVIRGANVNIYNNIILNNIHNWEGDIPFDVDVDSSGNVILKNNILQRPIGYPNNAGSLTSSNNMFLSGTPNDASGGGGGIGTNSFTGNAYFISTIDYHSLSSGQGIDTGTAISIVPNDIEGIIRPQGTAYDIGAYEYLSSSPTPTPTPTSTPGNLIFDDEFNDSSVDTAKWHLVSAGPENDLCGLNDLKTGTRNPSQITETGGNLVITGALVSGNPTSGMMYTNAFNFKYGYIEFRAKYPHGNGSSGQMWAGIVDSVDGKDSINWEGEVSKDTWVPDNRYIGDISTTASGGSAISTGIDAYILHTPTYWQDFHVYSATWTPTYVSYRIDGVEVWNQTDTSYISNSNLSIFIQNLLGTNGVCWGIPIDTSQLPSIMYVDYVRVYSGVPSSITPTPTPTPTQSIGGSEGMIPCNILDVGCNLTNLADWLLSFVLSIVNPVFDLITAILGLVYFIFILIVNLFIAIFTLGTSIVTNIIGFLTSVSSGDTTFAAILALLGTYISIVVFCRVWNIVSDLEIAGFKLPKIEL